MEESSVRDEVKRLAGDRPLKTLMKLMIGPLCSQLSSAILGIINYILISKYIGEVGTSAVATDVAWEYMFPFFLVFFEIFFDLNEFYYLCSLELC